MDLKKADKLNAKHIIRKLPSINKWCKNLNPIAWGVLYALKVHTKAIKFHLLLMILSIVCPRYFHQNVH